MDHAKLLDVLTSLPVSQSILPRAVFFATSRPANHAICSFIDSSGYASRPIRRCLFIDDIIIGVKSYIEKHAICLKDYRIRSFLSIRHAHGDLCKHLGIHSSTDLDDRYSNLFLNAYINRHAHTGHTEYLKMI